MLAQKVHFAEELNEAKNTLALVGLKLKKKVRYVLPDSKQERYVLIFEKVKETPKRFPRSFKQVLNKPL
jgi:16S rRNA (guanine527-N7)-methyltransferase